MGIFFTLRRDGAESLFKKFMLDMLDAIQPEEILLCSGYFQENKPYDDENGNKCYSSYQVTTDSDYNNLTICDVLSNTQQITLVGSKDDAQGYWGESYTSFYHNLRNSLGVDRVKAYRDKLNHWHAKEMLMLSNHMVIAGIIGSSNLTRPAYGSNYPPTYNIEADTYIYSDVYDQSVRVLLNQVQDGVNSSSIIVASYSPSLNGGRDECAKLQEHYDHIMAQINNVDLFDEIV